MIGRWRERWKARGEQAALERRAIRDDLWKRTLVRYPYLRRRDPADAAELRRLTSLFLDRKEFAAAGGLKLDDAMVVAVAAQAVLPVLRLGLAHYDGFVGIVLHPDTVVARRSAADEAGIVHEYDEWLSGEAMQGGPVMLSWHDVRIAGATAAAGYNVVIHEFAHVLDMEDGAADGVPVLPPDIAPREWGETMRAEFARFEREVEAGVETGLDPYGLEGPAEFFAVASEAFFVSPAALQREHPALYALFTRYYRQDPALETAARR